MPSLPRLARVVLALGLAAGAHFGLMWNVNRPLHPADATGRVASVSFVPHDKESNPEKGNAVPPEQIERDLKVVAQITNRVRTYSVWEGLDAVPRVADELGMKVTLGAWVDKGEERSRDEIEQAVRLAKRHRSVTEIIVGNEVILRGERTPEELIAMMREVRKRTGKPVTTAEVWGNWLEHPELAREADFLAVHILPFWEDVPAEKAVAHALEKYAELRKRYPNKRIVIAEFGWPSGKFNRRVSVPSLENQARIIREFVAEANKRHILYNIIEAFDQPWKVAEGNVGAYWGMFDADRKPKFPLAGGFAVDQRWDVKAAVGVLIGLLLALAPVARRRCRLPEALLIAFTGQVVGWGLAEAAVAPLGTYLGLGSGIMWAVGLPLVTAMAIIAFDRMREMAEVLFGGRPSWLIDPAQNDPTHLPKVSIHVPACGEPADMVIETLESMARLDYPDFEVLAVLNNTTRTDLVEPVRAACERLGPRFKFVHFPKISGFKAGALNGALAHTAPDAEIIACVDADYVVDPLWLRELCPTFKDPKVAIVQAPQDHRDGKQSWLKAMMDCEYQGFFDIGMVQRNEDDAIIAHGTMIMVRRSAFEEVGRWGETFICEDTELGLRLFETGYSARYTTKRYGHGLLPDTLRAYRRQRDRWAYGAMRIMLAHAKHMLPWSPTLRWSQKAHFLTGWLHWIGDAAAMLLAAANIVWTVYITQFGAGEPPQAPIAVGTLVVAALTLLHSAILYGARVDKGWRKALLAIPAGMSLQLTVAKAVFSGLVLASLPFNVTAKGGKTSTGLGQYLRGFLPEALLAAGLLWSAWAVHSINWDEVTELYMFSALLIVQSLPFLTAFLLGTAELVGGWLGPLVGRLRRKAAPETAAKAAV